MILSILLFFSLQSTASIHAETADIFITGEDHEFRARTTKRPYSTHANTIGFKNLPSTIKKLNSIELELPEGFSINIKKTKISKSVVGDFIWQGRVPQDLNSNVVFVVKKDSLVGEIYAGSKHYRIQYNSDGEPVIASTKMKYGKLPTDVYNPEPHPELQSSAQVTSESSDNFVDLIIGYTAEAAANANIETSLEALVTATNQMLEESCANFRFRLLSVMSTGVSTGTDDAYAILSDLQNTSGSYAALHSARESLGADLIHLFVDTDTIGLCGLANLGGSGGAYFDTQAFGLTLFGCPTFVLAHELGHNMSLRHDRYQQNLELTDESAAGGEHYGFVDTTNEYESIMSYQDHCIDNGTFCDRMDKFSNPRISHNGVAFGLDGFADNAHALNRSFPFVANYRTSQSSFDPGIDNNCSSSDANKDLHCFVATATYGSSLHPQIQILRDFRDNVLTTFALGRLFVRSYYQWGPRLALMIEKHPWLKLAARPIIASAIFVIEFYALIITFILVFIITRKPQYWFVILLMVSPWKGRAEISLEPIDPNILATNPSLHLSSSAYTQVGLSGYIISSDGSPSTLTTIKESGTQIDAYINYREPSYSLGLRYVPEWERSTQTTVTPFAETETIAKSSDIIIDFAVDALFGIPFGLRLIQNETKNFSSPNVQADKISTLSLNLGSQISFSSVNLGGGIIYNNASKTDSLNSDQTIGTGWLSLYLGLGLSLGSSGGGEYGGSSSSSGAQIEIGYQRDPQVVALESNSQLVRAETSRFHGLLQYSYPLTSDSLLLALKYEALTASPVDSFIDEPSNFDTTTIGLGYKSSGWTLTSNTFLRNEKNGFKRKELGILISLSLLFSSGGAGSTTSL